MNTVKFTGWLLVLGFIFLLAGALVAPQEAYVGELDERLETIRDHRSKWEFSKVLDGMGAALPGLALASMGIRLADRQRRPIWVRVAAVVLLFSAIVAIYFVYLLAANPGALWASGFPEPVSYIFLLSYLLGFSMMIFSITEHITPPWVFFLSATAALLGLIAAILFRASSPFYIFAALSVVNLVIGIMLIRGQTNGN